MKIAIFGASGKSGRPAVEQALQAGHEVVAFVRTPSKLKLTHERLTVAQGDVRNIPDIERALAGVDVVLSTIGETDSSSISISSEGTKNILTAMKKTGVRRFIVESAWGVHETHKGFYSAALWLIIASRMRDKELMEDAIRASGLEWVIVRPTILTNAPKTGTYRIGHDLPLGFFPKIARADVAEFMLKQVSESTFVGKTPAISY